MFGNPEVVGGFIKGGGSISYGWSPSVSGEARWTGGETLALRVAGSAQFPALEATLTAPFSTQIERLVLTEKPSGAQRVNWSPAIQTDVEITIAPTQWDSGMPWAECWFSGAEGSAEIPAQVLSELAWPAAHDVSGRGATHAEVSSSKGLLNFYAYREW